MDKVASRLELQAKMVGYPGNYLCAMFWQGAMKEDWKFPHDRKRWNIAGGHGYAPC